MDDSYAAKRPNPFRSRIHDVLTHKPDILSHGKVNEDSEYHKAVRALLHHRAIAELAGGFVRPDREKDKGFIKEKNAFNKGLAEEHEKKARELSWRLPHILREHPLPGDAVRHARNQKVPRKNLHHHLAELKKLKPGRRKPR